jgi:hypothetical protein
MPEIDKQLLAVHAYLKTRPNLHDAATAENQCRIAVQEALAIRPGCDELWVADAREVWLVGHRHPVPRNPPPRFHGAEIEHAVLCIADTVLVDLTRRQYDPRAEVPVVYASIEEAGRDWCYYVDEDCPDGPRRLLRDVL